MALVQQRERIAGLDVVLLLPQSGVTGVPVIVGLHGRGSSPERILSAAEQMGDPYVHVLPQGPIANGDGFAWYEKTEQRATQLAASREQLLEFARSLRERFQVGPEHLAVWGFSQGATLALELGLRSPSALAATVALSGKLDDQTRESDAIVRARGRDFLLVHGVRDEVVPHTESRKAYAALVANGGRAELAELPTGHQLGQIAIGSARGFLASCLGPAPLQA